MPITNSHYIPGYIWHITHRCQLEEFHLEFDRDKENWIKWLFEAKKRYGLCVLNYMVTSNHIHLMVWDNGTRETIPKSIQLIAGKVTQENHIREKRKGAFWEDRYHVTAVAMDDHLYRCMTYIDLNMVRAGVVKHPSEWPFCGYNEIQDPQQRYTPIGFKSLMHLLRVSNYEELKELCESRVENAISVMNKLRDGKWTESIAVGSKNFIETTKYLLGIEEKERKKINSGKGFEPMEPTESYNTDFTPENDVSWLDNTYYWKGTGT